MRKFGNALTYLFETLPTTIVSVEKLLLIYCNIEIKFLLYTVPKLYEDLV